MTVITTEVKVVALFVGTLTFLLLSIHFYAPFSVMYERHDFFATLFFHWQIGKKKNKIIIIKSIRLHVFHPYG